MSKENKISSLKKMKEDEIFRNKKILTTDETAKYLGISKSTLYG